MENIIYLKSIRINYLKTGNGPNKLFFFPGAFGTIWSDFKPQIEGLDKEIFTILVWDPPGQGLSRPPERVLNCDFFEYNADIAFELIKALKFEPFSLLGWCNGGISSMIFASKYPETLEKLIIWGTNSYVESKQLIVHESIRDIRNWPKKDLVGPLKIYGKNLLQQLQNEWCNVMLEFERRGGDICSSLLHRIKCPTLVLHGTKDKLIGEEHPEYLVNHIKGARLYTFHEGKHHFHQQYPEEFNSVIAEFLLSRFPNASFDDRRNIFG